MLGQLSRQVKSHSCLDFPARDGVFLVVVSQPGGLGGNTLKNVIDEGIHDAHGLGRDASVRVNLLQDLVDVDGVTLLAGLSPPLLSRWFALSGGFFLALFGCYFARHG